MFKNFFLLIYSIKWCESKHLRDVEILTLRKYIIRDAQSQSPPHEVGFGLHRPPNGDFTDAYIKPRVD